MAERDQVGGALGRHDPGDAGHSQDIAFLEIARADARKRRRLHPDAAAGDGDAPRCWFVADIDHGGAALSVEVG